MGHDFDILMEQQDLNQLKVIVQLVCIASVSCLTKRHWCRFKPALTAIRLLLCQVVRFWAQHLTRLATAFTAVSQTIWSPLAAMTAHMHNHMPLVRYCFLLIVLIIIVIIVFMLSS
jgi:hypothetical protein